MPAFSGTSMNTLTRRLSGTDAGSGMFMRIISLLNGMALLPVLLLLLGNVSGLVLVYVAVYVVLL